MNKCFFLGNLTRDPEVTYTGGGTAVCKFSIAVNEKYKKEGGEVVEKVHFLDIEAWGKQGEAIGQYFIKGKAILVECRVKQDTWEDKESGNKRSKLMFTLEKFEFLPGGSKKKDGDDDNEEGSDEDAAPAARSSKKPAKKKAAAKAAKDDDAGDDGNYGDGPYDEVPF